MKQKLFFWRELSASVILACALWAAFDFCETQKTCFNQTVAEKVSLQRDIKTLEADITFIKEHQKEIDFLIKKGWFIPKSRLIAGEAITKLQGSLNDVQYTFEPETTKSLKDSQDTFKMTKIELEVGALLDTDIYSFIHNLLETFPGILIPRELTLSRSAEINENNLLALRHNTRPHFITGKLIFEWVTLDEK
jgi:hypothetical protein